MVGRIFQCKPLKGDGSNTKKNKENVDVENHSNGECSNGSKLWRFSCITFFAILVLLFLMVLLPTLDQVDLRMQSMLNKQVSAGQDNCSFQIVESIPIGMVYENNTLKNPSTFETWKKLIKIAEHTIDIGSFYWTMKKSDKFPTESSQGDEIYNDLINAGLNRSITIRIAQNAPSKSFPSGDTEYLILKKVAQVKFLDFNVLLGSGILHTKFWIVDRKHLYVGSANLDWRALTEVKELGVAFYNCSPVAEDLAKVFEVYWLAGNQTVLPNKWPEDLGTIYNSKNPLNIQLNGNRHNLYISSSPPKFSTKGRNEDLDALLSIIEHAKEFIHISVMDYLPLVVFSKRLSFWPDIDNALRKAVIEKRVKVRLLISHWRNTKPMTSNFLKSLLALNNFKRNSVVEIKWFEVPFNETQSKIPFARVNHNKYMVTDTGGFIGTSNWSGDYFITTAGVSVVSPTINGSVNVIQQQLKYIFDRDWNSTFAYPLTL